MPSDNEKVLKKLKNVGNPMFIVHLINSTNKLISKNQAEKKAQDISSLFFDISGNYYEYDDKQIVSTDTVEGDSALISMKKDTVKQVSEIIGSDSSDLNKLFKDLRKVRNIKKYEELYNVLDQNFRINVTLSQLIRFFF